MTLDDKAQASVNSSLSSEKNSFSYVLVDIFWVTVNTNILKISAIKEMPS